MRIIPFLSPAKVVPSLSVNYPFKLITISLLELDYNFITLLVFEGFLCSFFQNLLIILKHRYPDVLLKETRSHNWSRLKPLLLHHLEIRSKLEIFQGSCQETGPRHFHQKGTQFSRRGVPIVVLSTPKMFVVILRGGNGPIHESVWNVCRTCNPSILSDRSFFQSDNCHQMFCIFPVWWKH